MKTATDTLARAKFALGIEEEPEAAPLAVRSKTTSPARVVEMPDRSRIAEALERAREAAAAPAAETAAPPPQVTRRVEIMVTGSMSRIGLVRNALRDLQSQLLRQASDGNLELRVTAFLDGCRHTTPWSRSPIDVSSRTTIWHCYEGSTRFSEALAHSANDAAPVDAIVIFGDRFDDNLAYTLGFADRLKEQGTRIYAFHVGKKLRSRNAFEQLAARTGGAFVQLSDQKAFARVMPVITAYVLRPAEALRALPATRDPDARTLVNRLKLLPPPSAATGRKS